MEAEQHPTASVTKKLTLSILQRFLGMLNDTLDYLEEVDPDYERAGLARRRMLASAAYYEQLLEKRREATQATLDSFFRRKASLPEASGSDEPQPGTSTGGCTRPNVSLPLP